MTNPNSPPEWAMQAAREVYAIGHNHDNPGLAQDIRAGRLDSRPLLLDIARALAATAERVERETIERCTAQAKAVADVTGAYLTLEAVQTTPRQYKETEDG